MAHDFETASDAIDTLIHYSNHQSSGGSPIVVAQHSPDPLTPSNTSLAGIGICRTRFDQPIAESLMVSLPMIMGRVRLDRTTKMVLPERNDS